MAEYLTETDGRQLAVDMLRELGQEWKSFDLSDAPDGEITETLIARDPDTMRRFLGVVQDKGSPALERGFLCVLSEYLGAAVADGCTLELEAYERHEAERS